VCMRLRWLLLGLLLTALLVPALLLTYDRLLDPPGGAWVRLLAFTPYALALYAVAFLLLLLAWWRGHGFWRGTARLLVVVSMVGMLLHAFWASGPYLGTPAADAAAHHRLHVMTANLLFGEGDTSRVVEVAVADDVDVLVLQEVTPQALSGLESAGLGQAFGHHAGTPAAGPAGTMVFSRYPLRDVHRLATLYGGYSMDLRTPAGRVHLLAVHPRPPTGDVSGWRTDQGVVRHAARATSRRTLVVGDLNATMDHVPMRSLVGIGFADAATQANSQWQPTWPSSGEVSRFGVSVPSLVAIDHVLLSSGLRALRTESVTVPGTDHRALVAVVAL
jgi:endonuclease/exonuclease/phosphatase family metal-dependent hydrolase